MYDGVEACNHLWRSDYDGRNFALLRLVDIGAVLPIEPRPYLQEALRLREGVAVPIDGKILLADGCVKIYGCVVVDIECEVEDAVAAMLVAKDDDAIGGGIGKGFVIEDEWQLAIVEVEIEIVVSLGGVLREDNVEVLVSDFEVVGTRVAESYSFVFPAPLIVANPSMNRVEGTW